MNYILKHFDTPLLKFRVVENISTPVVEILWENVEEQQLFPMDMVKSAKGVGKWLARRTIPKNRAYVNDLLAKSGLNANRPMDVLSVCRGLSLNDSYWVVEEGFTGTFDEYNLYENKFNRVLSLVAFTGYGSENRTSLMSSPEFTTNGMLPKCWRRESGVISLYKGATSGFSNTGFEPYSEFYAWKIAEAMEIHAIPYNIKKWKGRLCSVCELFTAKELAYLPVGYLVPEGGMKAVRQYYRELGPEFEAALNEMLVFDAIICNTDRHYGNFGVLIDSRTNRIVAPAPLFDHGNSLFSLAGQEALSSGKHFQRYADLQMPHGYEDFITEAKAALDNTLREKVRRMLDFKLPRHARYNLPGERIRLIEEQLHRRAKLILE